MGTINSAGGVLNRVQSSSSLQSKDCSDKPSKRSIVGQSITARNTEPLTQKCYRTSQFMGPRRFFQPSFLSTQAHRRPQNDSEFTSTQQISACEPFQDGKHSFHHSGIGTKRLGSNNRFKGCLPPYSCPACPQEVSQVFSSGTGLSVPLSSFWFGNSTKSFHKGSNQCDSIPTSEGSSNTCVPRRLGPSQHKLSEISAGYSINSENFEESRFPVKSREVTFAANADTRLLRSTVSSEQGCGDNNRGSLEKAAGIDCTISTEQGLCSKDPRVVRPNGFLSRNGSASKASYETITILPIKQMASKFSKSDDDDSNREQSEDISKMVDKEIKSVQRAISTDSKPRDDNYDRCIPLGLGGTSGTVSGGGTVDPRPSKAPHKLVGVESSSTSSPKIPQVDIRESSACQERQLNNGGIHSKPGGNKVPRFVCSAVGNSVVVQQKCNSSKSSSHCRQEKFSSGRTIQRESGSNRVDLESSSCKSVISDMGDSDDRHVCESEQCKTASVLFTSVRHKGSDDRCISSELERALPLCIPTSDSGPQGASKNKTGRLHRSSHSSKLATSVVVPSVASASDRSSNRVTTRKTASLSAKVGNRTPLSRKIMPDCMEIVSKRCVEKGFSESVARRIAQCRRRSTRSTYDAKLRLFYRWCDEQSVDPLEASVVQVANFLEYLFQVKRLQPSTIAGYRAAISAVHQGWEDESVSTSEALSKLIRSFFIERPPSKTLLPSWSLPLVLCRLNQAPFEPLDKSSLKYLTMKTVFLLAIASGRRVGDLQALSIDKGRIRWEPYGARLTPRLGYLAKNESLAHRAKPVFIPKFDSYATEGEDIKQCPVRALDIYVRTTKSLRGKEKQLFISYQNHKPISKERLSNWITDTIKFAYENAKEADLRLHAHSTRSLSSSWALFQGASIESIVQAAFWVRETTFTSFYLRDVLSKEGEFARAVLSAGKKCTALDPVS